MSAETWLAEHYPVPAHSFVSKPEQHNDRLHWGKDDPTKVIAAVEHSLVKWRGLRREVLAKHGLHLTAAADVADADGKVVLVIDGESCSLCVRYAPCMYCPIVGAMGRACAGAYSREFDRFISGSRKGDPEPMIELLERTLDHVKKEFGV